MPSSLSFVNLIKNFRDFNEITSSGYRPGCIKYTGDDFAISVSVPVIKLTDCIPAHALLAWDKRLLSKTRNLTLLITGCHGSYPLEIPSENGADNSRTQFHFKVAIVDTYKPSKGSVIEVLRAIQFLDKDESILKLTRYHTKTVGSETVDGNEEENSDMKSEKLEPFSWSASLESYLDRHLMRVIRLRRKFQLGWAGAEQLMFDMEALNQREDEIFKLKQQVCPSNSRGSNRFITLLGNYSCRYCGS